MIRFLSWVFILFLPCQALAKAPIRSGEHGEFTRLVVTLNKDATWSLNRRENSYQFEVPEWEEGFDTSTIFRKITTNRLLSVNAAPNFLDLILNCDCEIIAKPYGENEVILDIREAEKQVGKPTDKSPKERIVLPQILGKNSQLLQIEDAFDRNSKSLSDLRKSLAEQLGRASSLALLDPIKIDHPNPVPSPDKVDITPQIDDSVAQDMEFEFKPDRMRIRSAMEQALDDTKSERIEDQSAQYCYDKDAVNIGAWGTQEPFGDQLGDLRRVAMVEFDEPVNSQLLKLSRLYLYFGMGAEARHVIRQFALSTRDAATTETLSRIIDQKNISKTEPIYNMANCEGNIALWAVLAKGTGPSISLAQSEAIASAFSELPYHLRSLLGPRLIAIFTAGGNAVGAGVIRNAILRGGNEEPTHAAFVNIKQNLGNKDTLRLLLPLIERNDENSPEALSLYIQSSLMQGQLPPTDLLDLAAAYKKQLAGTPMSSQLAVNLINSQIYTAEFRAAFNAATRQIFDDNNDRDELFSSLFLALGQRGTNSDVAIISFQMLQLPYPPKLSAEALNMVAAKLLETGMPDLAQKMFVSRNDQAKDALYAKILNQLGKSDEASGVLRDLDGPEAIQIQTDILMRSGDFADAWARYAQQLEPDLKDQLAWLAGVWGEIETDEVKREAGQLLESARASQPDGLEAAGKKIQESEETRRLLNTLLAETVNK